MRTSICVLLMMLPAILLSAISEAASDWSPTEIDNAWIKVPWTRGGYYYHNTLTREDQDYPPSCLSSDCPWN